MANRTKTEPEMNASLTSYKIKLKKSYYITDFTLTISFIFSHVQTASYTHIGNLFILALWQYFRQFLI